jgi:peptidoglycan/LPS O-acetylase OafA/YrhL
VWSAWSVFVLIVFILLFIATLVAMVRVTVNYAEKRRSDAGATEQSPSAAAASSVLIDRLTYVDTIRVICTFGIAWGHAQGHFDAVLSARKALTQWPTSAIGYTPLAFIYSGRYCLAFFFLISGFVCPYKALSQGSWEGLVSAAHKRIWRLWPVAVFVQAVVVVFSYALHLSGNRSYGTDCRDDMTWDCLTDEGSVGVLSGLSTYGLWGVILANNNAYTGPFWPLIYFVISPYLCLVLYLLFVYKRGWVAQLTGICLCIGLFGLGGEMMFAPFLICMGFFIAAAHTGNMDDLLSFFGKDSPYWTYFFAALSLGTNALLVHAKVARYDDYSNCYGSTGHRGGSAGCHFPVEIASLAFFLFVLTSPRTQWFLEALLIWRVGPYMFSIYLWHSVVFHAMHVLGGYEVYYSWQNEATVAADVANSGFHTLFAGMGRTAYGFLTVGILAVLAVFSHHCIERPGNRLAERFAAHMIASTSKGPVLDAEKATLLAAEPTRPVI